MPNPYSFGPVITNPTMFFGRESELETLYTRLRNMQSTSVVGLRRIGKSSLLYQLAQTLPDKLGRNFVPLYIDLQDARYRTAAAFVKEVTTALNEKVGGTLAVGDVTDMSSFSKMIDGLHSSGICPVLCLDEFEEFIQYPHEFDDSFFEALRALGTSAKLAMVTTSRTSLADLIRAGRLTSPLPNIFSQIELGLLKSEEARALRRDPFARENITLSQENESLVKGLGGRHPYYLQMACHLLYEALSRPSGKPVEMAVREQFNQEAEQHFERLWIHLDIKEMTALKFVTGQAVLTNEAKRTLERLARLGMVEKIKGNWYIFSSAFAKYVQECPIIIPQTASAKSQIEKPESLTTTSSNLLLLGVVLLFGLMLCSLTIGLINDNITLILFALFPAGILLVFYVLSRLAEVGHK
jgi:hypothetical protein